VEKFDKLGISGKSGDPHPSLLDSKLDKFSKGELEAATMYQFIFSHCCNSSGFLL